jgi:hypothetical protein
MPVISIFSYRYLPLYLRPSLGMIVKYMLSMKKNHHEAPF